MQYPHPQPAKPRPLQRRREGTLTVVTGASRTGKTTWVADEVAFYRRLLVWDSADEWAHRFKCRRVLETAALAAAVRPGAPDARLAFCVPVTAESFAYFCRIAWIFIRVAPGAVVVEELADVTSPGKAPAYWGEIVRKGLRYGPAIYALTQRPSESDKTVIGNATVLHTHQMARAEDSRYMARELRLEESLVDGLLPYHWIERDRRTKALRNGKCARSRK